MLLKDFGAEEHQPTVIMEDNQGDICIAKNPVAHSRTKHTDIRYHYIREAICDDFVQLQYCPTEAMTADLNFPFGFTKRKVLDAPWKDGSGKIQASTT